MRPNILFDTSRSEIQAHMRGAESFVLSLTATYKDLRASVVDEQGLLDLHAIPDIPAYLSLGVIDKTEFQTQLALDLAPFTSLGLNMLDSKNDIDKLPSDIVEAYNNVCEVALDFAFYRFSKYASPAEVASIFSGLNPNIFNSSNLQKLVRVLPAIKYDDVLLFPNINLEVIEANVASISDLKHGPNFFSNALMQKLAYIGHSSLVFNYLKSRTAEFDLSSYGNTFTACAKAGLCDEVLAFVESPDGLRVDGIERVLSNVLTNDTKERVYQQAIRYLGYRDFNSIAPILATLGQHHKEFANDIAEAVQQYRNVPKYRLRYEQVMASCVTQKNARESLEYVRLGDQELVYYEDVALVCAAIYADKSLVQEAFELSKLRYGMYDGELLESVLEYCAREGMHQQVFDFLVENRITDQRCFTLLHACYECGMTQEVSDFINLHVQATPDLRTQLLEEKKQGMIRGVARLLRSISMPADSAEDLCQGLELMFRDMSNSEVQFLSMFMKEYGVFHPKFIDLISGNASRVEVGKTGSSLYLLGGDLLGVLVNRVDEVSARAWKQLADELPDPIPVAPIIRYGHIHDGIRSVYSRYCGPSLGEFIDTFGLKSSFSLITFPGTPQDYSYFYQDLEFLYGAKDPLIKSVMSQAVQIIQNLDRRGIEHGHPHKNNFVVELIDSGYLNEYLSTTGESGSCHTINNIPYKEEHFTFDFMRYAEVNESGDSRWTAVVRLIDLDQAREVPNASLLI